MKNKISITSVFTKVTFIFLIIVLSISSCSNKNTIIDEKYEYNIAKKINTIETYKDFIDIFPNSKYYDEIKSKINEVEHKDSSAIDKNDYYIACLDDNISSYNSYLKKYPAGFYKDEARRHIDSLCKEGYIDISSMDIITKEDYNENTEYGYKSIIGKFLENQGIVVAENKSNSISVFCSATAEGNTYVKDNYSKIYFNSGYGKLVLIVKIKNNIVINKTFNEKVEPAENIQLGGGNVNSKKDMINMICSSLSSKCLSAIKEYYFPKFGYCEGLFSNLGKNELLDLDLFSTDTRFDRKYRNKKFIKNIKTALTNCILNNDLPREIRINAYCILNHSLLHYADENFYDDRKIIEWISKERKETFATSCIESISGHLYSLENLSKSDWEAKDSFEKNYYDALHDNYDKCSSLILLQLYRTKYLYNGFQENIKRELWDRFHRDDFIFETTNTSAL
jgi:hypothetical protein